MENTTLKDEYISRFAGIARLYGHPALQALCRAHITVVGLGGVGSWAAEALTRSGIGELTLIELDDICVSNTNRQIHTEQTNIGREKNQVMCERLRAINPDIIIHQIDDFLDKNNMAELIGPQHDVVVDATDSAHIKAALVAYSSARKIKLVMSGSSGGKRDPSKICISDLAHTESDAMLAKVRSQLYRHYHFARDKNRKFRVDVIYSKEQMHYPAPDGSVSQCKSRMQDGVKLDCAGGFGAATMVTGSFGFYAASCAIDRYLQKALSK